MADDPPVPAPPPAQEPDVLPPPEQIPDRVIEREGGKTEVFKRPVEL